MNARAALKLARDVGGCMLTGRPKPLVVFLYLSFKCNLRCTYCNLPNLAGDELAADQWLAIIDQLAELGCRRINFIGGEPLLYPGLGRLLARAAQHDISRVVCSNGILVPDKLEVLRSASNLCLSLDGIDDEGNLGRGPRVRQAVQRAVTAAASIGLPVKINTVVSTHNQATLPLLVEMVTREWKVPITISAVRTGNRRLNKDAEDIRLCDCQMRELFKILAAMAKSNPRILYSPRTYRIGSLWPDYGMDCLRSPDGEAMADGPACQAGKYYFSILPDGRAAPCAIHLEHTGDLSATQHTVAEVWREQHNHDCQSCYSPCMVEMNNLFSFQPGMLFNFAKRHVPRLS